LKRGLRNRFGAGLVGLVVVAGVLPVVSAAPCAAASPAFIAPVDGPVARGFDPPLGPYAAGHRGIDFEVASGTEVGASAGGEVIFSGPVAGDGLFVTIQHSGGISTTYSFLSEVRVAVEQRVKQGEVIALSGEGHPGLGVAALHFGAKLGEAYIDPELLLFGNLKDISDAIALAPISGPAGSDIGPVEPNGSFLRPPAQFRPRDEAALHGFEAAGSKIAGAGRTIWAAPVSAWHWISSRAVSAGHLIQGLGAAGGRATRILSASTSRATGFIGRTVALARHTVAVAKRGSQWASRHFQRLSHLLGRAGSWFASLGRFRLASSFLAHIKSTINSMKDTGRLAFGMIKGVGGQIRCTIKGGATPPPIPAALDQGPAPKAPNGNIVVAVAGIGSHTDRQKNGTITSNADMYSMDLRTLGFKEDQIFHFSYKGIEQGGQGPYRLHAPYSKKDTYKSIRESAELLSKQLRAIHRLYPNKKIDVVAHSQGGLVAEYCIEHFYRPDSAKSPHLAHYVTIATPHQGTDGALLYSALSRGSLGQAVASGLDQVADGTGLPRPSATSVREMAEGSSFIRELNKGWDPRKVRTTTVGAAFDFVVPAPHTLLKGSAHYTTNLSNFSFSSLNAHSAAVSATTTKGIVYNALRDTPSACTSLRDAFADFGTGRVISNVEQELVQGLGDVVAVANAFIGNKRS
jgi:peptidase M23-like protein/putative serine esterase DUF676